MSRAKIIVILGPTASGKSELAVRIAKKFNGEIISADSRQVYKGLDTGTGKVPRDQISKSKFLISKQSYFYKGIEHHLLDVASSKRTFTVVQYQKLAKRALEKIFNKNKIPIICGGAGFYIDTLIYDYQLPKVLPNQRLRKKLEKLELTDLLKILKKLDSERYETVDQKNKRRVIRAIEIAKVLGKISPIPPLGDRVSKYNVLKIGIAVSREELKNRIKRRLFKRLHQGMIQEVENLHKKGLSWRRLDNFGLEYRYVSRYLQSLMSKEELVKTLNREIYKYAKRQMTWFRKDKKIHWIKDYRQTENLILDLMQGKDYFKRDVN